MKSWVAGEKLNSDDLNNNFKEVYIGQYGDGSDGAVDFDGTNTFLFASKSVNDYTLTRDVFADELVIGTGCTLNPGGYKIYAKTSITREGTGKIVNNGGDGGNGGNGSSGVAGVAGTAGAQANAEGSLPASLVGEPGGSNSVGDNGVAQVKPILSVAGKDGGDGGSGFNGISSTPGLSGGSGGSVTSDIVNKIINFITAFNLFDVLSGGVDFFTINPSGGGGGAGGDDGSGDECGGGGGSGGSGGIVWISTPYIIDIEIEANGGDGGAGGDGFGDGGAGGGGASGNGGIIIAIYRTKGTLTTSVSGGSGGLGSTVGYGTNGSDGEDGASGVVYELTY